MEHVAKGNKHKLKKSSDLKMEELSSLAAGQSQVADGPHFLTTHWFVTSILKLGIMPLACAVMLKKGLL